MNSNTLSLRPLLSWLVVALFYFYQFLLQVTPSVLKPEIVRDFNCSSLEFGSLSAYFLYAYALMQIPVGLILDKKGPRWVMTIAAVVCSIGCYLFAQSDTLAIAKFGRFLMGLGGAFGAVGCMKVASMQFESKYFSLMTGLAVMIGMSGALFGQAMIGAFINDSIDWRDVFTNLAMLGFAVSLLIAIAVSNHTYYEPDNAEYETKLSLKEELMMVVSNKKSWFAALYAGLMYTPTLAFGELWGVPFLTEGHSISRAFAGKIVPCMFLGWICGSPLFGLLAEKYHRNHLMLLCNIVVLALVCITISPITANWTVGYWIMDFFLIGLFSSGFILAFTSVKEANSPEVAATSSGFTNTINTICGALAQPLIGYILDGIVPNGAQPNLANYHLALTSLVFCLVAALIFMLKLIHLERNHKS